MKGFIKFFESFKENVNKHFEKLNENYNFLLLSTLIAGWGLGCSPSFAIVPGFRGGGKLYPPGYATGVPCTMKLPNFPNFQFNANNYAIDPYRISTSGGGKNHALFWHAMSEIICSLFSHSVCVFPSLIHIVGNRYPSIHGFLEFTVLAFAL